MDRTSRDLPPLDGPQRIDVRVELVPGPFTEAVAGRILQVVVDELGRIGSEVTSVRVELRGWMASW